MSTLSTEKKPINFIKQLLKPLSAKVATTETVITVAEGEGIFYVAIPKEYMTANLATGVSAILTLTSGVASTETAIINIAASEATNSNNFFDTFYIDSVGNISRIGAGIIESGANYTLHGDGTLEQWYEETAETTTNLANGAIYYGSVDMTLPIEYSSISLVIPTVRASSELTWAGRGYAKSMTVINVTVLGATAAARGRAGYFVRGKI